MKVQIVYIIAHGKHNAQEVHECSLLENVEHCGGDSEQADTGYCATHAHPFTIHRGFKKGFCFVLNIKY